MKNYQYKLILTFFVVSSLIVLGIGISFIVVLHNHAFEPRSMDKAIGIIIFIAMAMLAIASIIMAVITVQRIIKPMSRMLKSASDYNNQEGYLNSDNEELDDIVNDLQDRLIEANRQKIQTETILKHMTDGVISFNMKGKVTYINPAAKYMLELRDTDNTFHKIFSKYNDINMEKIIYLEDWTSSEKKIENNQGAMNLFFVPFKDEINRPTGVMVVVQNITEHVKLDNMRKEFVADVSHELKTPLTSIKGFSETLIEGVDDKETEMHFLSIINDNAVRMEKLVQDLLILSKYDNNKSKRKLVEFDIGELSKSCAEKFEIEVKKKKQTLQCLVTADVPHVLADKDGIERVIINIISNSVKYTQEGGTIDIFVGYVHNDAYVKIKDNGMGIPEKDLDRIFERFYRVDKARTRQLGGTGLGLSIAKEIMEQNNGNIDIKSKVGEGTEVVLRIPVKK